MVGYFFLSNFAMLGHLMKKYYFWPSTVPIFPLPRCWINNTEQFVVGHGLRIEIVVVRFSLLIVVSSVESFPNLGLSGSGQADDKDRVTHVEQFFQLHDL